MIIRIGLVGDYDATVTAHRAIPKAIEKSVDILKADVEPVWVPTDSVPYADLAQYDAIWCVPASPYRSMEGAIEAIRFARETDRPYLGTCAGFQHALIEYARNVLGIKNADHQETKPNGDELVVTKMACDLVEQEEIIDIVPGTKLSASYGVAKTRERYHCRFALNPKHRARFEAAGVCTNAFGREGEVRGMEWPNHRFFIGVLFQPERWALRDQPNPLITSFVQAAGARLRERAGV